MIARFFIKLPFNIAISKTAVFSVYEYESEGYKVHILAPSYTEERAVGDPDELRLDGEPAVLANMLQIEFHKDQFDRRPQGTFDPPEGIITEAIRFFVARLRHVARAPMARLPEFPMGTWRLEYRKNDGTELEPAEGRIRARFGGKFLAVSCVSLTTTVWNTIHALPPAYDPPQWEALLLDAQGELPKIGTSIVLAATALEVFVGRLLNDLAAQSTVPPKLWSWISEERGDYRLEPTLEEQYDVLLNFFTGHSLKDEATLWTSFKNLKQARNTFVHEGTARIGNTPVDSVRAGELVASAFSITTKIREWLPDTLRWPVFQFEIKLEIVKELSSALGKKGTVPSAHGGG